MLKVECSSIWISYWVVEISDVRWKANNNLFNFKKLLAFTMSELVSGYFRVWISSNMFAINLISPSWKKNEKWRERKASPRRKWEWSRPKRPSLAHDFNSIFGRFALRSSDLCPLTPKMEELQGGPIDAFLWVYTLPVKDQPKHSYYLQRVQIWTS